MLPYISPFHHIAIFHLSSAYIKDYLLYNKGLDMQISLSSSATLSYTSYFSHKRSIVQYNEDANIYGITSFEYWPRHYKDEAGFAMFLCYPGPNLQTSFSKLDMSTKWYAKK